MALKRPCDAGKLSSVRATFWEPRPFVELYDLQDDPDDMHNLCADPANRKTLERLRRALDGWMLETRDLSFLPENETYSRPGNEAPYTIGRRPGGFPLETVLKTAQAAAERDASANAQHIQALEHEDSAVRYWGAMGLLMRGQAAVSVGRPSPESLGRRSASRPSGGRRSAGEIWL